MSGKVLNIEAYRSAVDSMPADDLAQFRGAGLLAFAATGFPTPNDEDWKYTDLAEVVDISQAWLDAGAGHADIDADAIRDIQATFDAAWVVIANGRIDESLSTGLDEAGYSIELGAQLGQDFNDPLSGLNAALLTDSLRIKVGEDLDEQRPLALLIADTTGDERAASQVRVDIEIAPGSRARVVEYHYSSGKSSHWSNTFVRLHVQPNASADYVRLQRRAEHHNQTARLNVTLERDARLCHFGADLGGKLARNDLKIDIAGPGASADFNGVYFAGNGQHIDNHTRIEHRVGPAESRQEYRGILAGKCRAVWNGKAIVHKGADGTDAKQANHNLLLSEGAEIDAKPELEIYAEEVKCAHGTTVGQLDEASLFYLRTRGLDKERARRVLTRAFAASVVNTLPLVELRELVGEIVEDHLQTLIEGASR